MPGAQITKAPVSTDAPAYIPFNGLPLTLLFSLLSLFQLLSLPSLRPGVLPQQDDSQETPKTDPYAYSSGF